ncbi:hypothetical protein DFH09DRAFT_1104346 [Mycena vulgaris]|nr:hypothetical protein DFH09DRAFT_1104346 [Mycena vulgaris]
MSFEQRQELIEIDHGDETQYQFMDIDIDNFNDNDYEDVETAFGTFPPGKEAFLQSHAGGKAIFQQIFDDFKKRFLMAARRSDSRVRREHVQIAINKWQIQIECLIDAYLQYKVEGPVQVDGADLWPLHVLSFSETGTRLFSHPPGSSRSNQTLLLHGYLGFSPESPAIVFPLEFLETYHQIHRVCPDFSFDALAKALNHLRKVPCTKYLRDQLSNAYDTYLAILRGVEDRVQKLLGHADDWYMKNVCPPCLYKVAGEPRLKYSMFAAMDRNNSLKLVDAMFNAGTPRSDDRKSTLFRWLTPQQVDAFKDEVANSTPRKHKTPATPAAAPSVPSSGPEPLDTAPGSNPVPPPDDPVPQLIEVADEDDITWLNVHELDEGDFAELTNSVNTCVDRWKNAGPEACKKMFALFTIAGIFVFVCRHGHVLVMCDMVQSGEFSLGVKTVALRLRGIVPAFHGHVHNRECQIGWHPLYVDGVGLEDFEECERTFAKSNNLASTTHMSTPFHRQQQIDEHFFFHDLDKHASSAWTGNFIFQNYRQAIKKINVNTPQLEALEQKTKTSAPDYKKFLQDEKDYFAARKSEPPEVVRTVDYMDLLEKLQKANTEHDEAKAENSSLDYLIVVKGYTKPQIAQEEVAQFEEEHEIPECWVPGSKEYEEALVLLVERNYRRALDKLESLVVQRLFELTKLGMNGVGYKLREKISKALRTRAEAIQVALNKYNLAATQLNPPRDRLSWTTVIDTMHLAEFNLLRDTRSDIRSFLWAKSANREAMVLYFGIKRAKEEIRHLNVEIQRLVMFMADDHVDYIRAIRSNVMVAPHLAHELSQQWLHCTRIHESIVSKPIKGAGFG